MPESETEKKKVTAGGWMLECIVPVNCKKNVNLIFPLVIISKTWYNNTVDFCVYTP